MASIITPRAPSPSPSSSSSTTGWKYQVFLSFRGDDTRNSFTDHLCKELRQKNIRFFRDNEHIPRGGVIDLELMKAIKQSQFAIIVLSEKYADSTSCLDELDEINKCRETTGITVFPVFYHVDPSDVKNLTGIFATELAKHVTVEVERIENWKKALMEVGNIAGWECTRKIPETEVIEKIVGSIRSKLYGNLPSVPNKDELKLVKSSSIREEKKKRRLSCLVHKPSKKLKSQLLKEKEQQLLVTAPGGCGKTMLCQDEQIKKSMAGTLVGGAFLSSFLQVAFDRLASPEVVNYLKGNKPVDRLLRKLKMELISARVVLNDAEEKQYTNPDVKEWLDELKDAVYDADDILDRIAYEALRCKLEAESQTGTSKVCPFSTSELEEMLERLKDITENMNVLGLKEVASGGGGVALPLSRL